MFVCRLGSTSVFCKLFNTTIRKINASYCWKKGPTGLVFTRNKMASTWRSIVHLKDNISDAQTTPAVFEKCVLRKFGCTGLKMTVGFIYSDGVLSIYPSEAGIRLEHPPGCPCCFLTANDISDINDKHKSTGVRVGVSVLVQSTDKKVLITRRSKHLRTFPGVWVPPGGHLEEGESLEEAGLRELEEETGLTVAKAQYGEGLVLGLWESVYPPLFTMGLPKRHHIVVYLLAESNKTCAELNEELKLDENEVDAVAWLDEDIVKQICQSDEHGKAVKTTGKFFEAIVSVDGQHQLQHLCQSTLMISAPTNAANEFQDQERLSSGTKFALKQWYRILHENSDIPKRKRTDSIGSLFHVVSRDSHKPAKFPFLG